MPSDITPPPADSTRLYSAVDRSNETYEPSPHASRRMVPSGDVSPDGQRTWPKSSLTSRVVVYGGIGIAAAAATAGAVLAVRTVVDAVAGDDEDDAVEAARQRARARRAGQSRPQRSSYAPRQAVGFSGSRGDDREERHRREAARRRAAAVRPQNSASLVDSVNETVNNVAGGMRDILATVTAAIEGFRTVAAQAGDVMADFNRAADQVKSMIEPVSRPRPAPGGAAPGGYARPSRKDVVDLREGETQDADARSHRL